MEERLQKVLAKAGVASRRHAEELIVGGKVKVNDRIVTELGSKVDACKDTIEVNGQIIPPPEQKVYYLLHKPRGYVTTLSDERGRKTVIDLLDGIDQRVYPVGRLDYDSEGLLLLTNDGDLTNALTHPRNKVKKTYLARVEGVPEAEKLQAMAKGMELADGPTAPAEVRLAGIRDNRALLEITIHEGRNRQVRRMCEQIGHPVVRLRRTRFGPLELGDLRPGQYRPLTKQELRAVLSAAGLRMKAGELQEAVARSQIKGGKKIKAIPSGEAPKKRNPEQRSYKSKGTGSGKDCRPRTTRGVSKGKNLNNKYQ